MTSPDERPTPEHIMEVALGFFASKTLLTAVNLGVFDVLASGPATREELEAALDLHSRSSADFLDALVALGVLQREDGTYRNTAEADAFLVSTEPGYIGNLLKMANDRLYPFWGDLETALRTGKPTNELEDDESHPFEEAIYEEDDRLEQFVGAMTGLSKGVANVLAHEFPWRQYETVVDLGTSEGIVPRRIAEENSHIRAIGVDLPRVERHFRQFTEESPVSDRIEFRSGDFFADDDLPSGDVYVLGHILHDWGTTEKKEILEKVAHAVNEDGAIIVYGTLIDDERKQNAMGLLMSLNMLVETPNGYDYTYSQCAQWLREVGFSDPQRADLPGPASMMVARK